jgi:hypothetical protein
MCGFLCKLELWMSIIEDNQFHDGDNTLKFCRKNCLILPKCKKKIKIKSIPPTGHEAPYGCET